MFEGIKSYFARLKAPSTATSPARRTTADRPFVINNPCLGILNLAGEAGRALYDKDLSDLGSLFPNNVNLGAGQIPRCNVLFLYCSLEPTGRIVGQSLSLRDAIKGAGAHIAVVASEIDLKVIQTTEFAKFIGANGDWPANIVITGNRHGDAFGRFFRNLFDQMRNGTSMPLAWVKLAPQGPQQTHSDCPGTLCLFEAGHIVFNPI